MQNNRNLIAGILILLPLLIWAGTTGKITGTITDSETGLPLPGVNIVVEGTIFGTATNANGYYIITNIPAGTYTLTSSMIGYKKMVVNNVKVSVDLTNRQDFELIPTVLEGEEIIVEAKRPLIQQDVTSSRFIQSGDDLIRMPVDNYAAALTTIAGAVMEENQLHIRGGRSSEVTFLLDNTSMVDPLSGNNDSEISNFAIEETHVMTGGFSAEYGNAQSGVINVVTKDGGASFNGRFRYTTSGYGLSDKLSTVRENEVPENLNRYEVSLSGPNPFANSILPLPGKLNYLLTGDFYNTQRRYINEDKVASSILGKLTYRPVPQLTFRFNVLQTVEKYDYFDMFDRSNNLWKKSVYEDRQVRYAFRDDDGDGINDNRNFIPGWYDNGVLDSEDLGIKIGNIVWGANNGRLDYIDVNGSGEWEAGEPTEDVNGNGTLDNEDLDHNGQIDKFNMWDHLADINEKTSQLGFYVMHQLSERTFYELKVHRYRTRFFSNPKEIINEDLDGDGKLDAVDENILTATGDYLWIDLDGDGFFDRGNEDLNGNGILDEYGVDLFTDNNSNEYVDASEIGPAPREYFERMGIRDPESTWMRWADIPYQGQKDYDGFYTYGSGTTWDRTNWYLDESTVYGIKFDFDSQITETQRLRTGIDVQLQNIFRLDGTDRYGYGEKFRVKPKQYAIYFNDKMEYGSMIMNIGIRYDYFDAHWKDYPNNVDDPTWDQGTEQFFDGNEDANNNGRLDKGEDLNGNGVLDQSWNAEKYQIGVDADGFPIYKIYPGEIKDPRSVPTRDFLSPRFGISFPITENDKMYFSYGRFFSKPTGNTLYRNLQFDMGGGFPVIGNPQLEPEKTTSYEAGVQHAFRNLSATLELKGFFKNVTGLVDSRAIYFNSRDWYAFYYNNDYGTIRGFEITYSQRPVPFMFFTYGGSTNYTFAIAKNKASKTFDGYITEWAGDIHPTEETFTDWDQRHTINVNLDVRTINQLGPIFGNWSANTLYRYGSGMRWTPPQGQDKAALDNTRVMPSKHTVDVRLGKLFYIGGMEFECLLDIRNLFDRKNVVWIADEEWYAADQDGDGKPDYDPQGKYDDPTVYERGRLVRLILETNF